LAEYTDQQGLRVLHALPLQLDEAENRTLAAAPAKPRAARLIPPGQPPLPDDRRIPAAHLDALQTREPAGARAGAAAAGLSVREIARRYADAVVLVGSGEGSGTGFFVGSRGYVVTCAHVLPVVGDPTVSYRTTRGAGKAVLTKVPALIVRVDTKRDLALLMVRPRPGDAPAKAPARAPAKAAGKPSGFPTVRLGDSEAVELGEDVTVIGHPGLGNDVLDFTVTSGIVSNPGRTPIDVTYLQTNAAVNPGNSGGPVFDSRGHVIGVVMAKAATLEGVGFAVSAKDLKSFLRSCTTDGRTE
jgi:serine protease Do